MEHLTTSGIRPLAMEGQLVRVSLNSILPTDEVRAEALKNEKSRQLMKRYVQQALVKGDGG